MNALHTRFNDRSEADFAKHQKRNADDFQPPQPTTSLPFLVGIMMENNPQSTQINVKEYQAWHEGGSSSILIYNFWKSLQWRQRVQDELNCTDEHSLLDDNRPPHIDPIIWGAIYSTSYQASREFCWIQARWYCYLLSYLSLHVSLDFVAADENRVAIRIGMIVGSILMGLTIYYACIYKLNRDMRWVAQQLNPILQPAGYWVEYRIESTGQCNSNEHRFCILSSAAPSRSLLEALPPVSSSSVPLASEPVAVCIFAPWYRHVVEWIGCRGLCCGKRTIFLDDAQPSALASIHPFVWGALVDAFTEPKIKRYRRQLVYILQFFAIFVVLDILDDRSNNRQPRVNPLLFLLFLFTVSLFSQERMLLWLAGESGYQRWRQAIETWQPSISGWQLQLWLNDAPETTPQVGCGSPPSVFVQFVPVSVW